MRAIDADALKVDYIVPSTTAGTTSYMYVSLSQILNAPTIEPERKNGRWKQIHVGGFTPGGNSLSVCSECGWEFGTHMIYPDYNYCPNCGADMRGDKR